MNDLRTQRKALGLSQRKLAEALGVSTNTVARWERGELRIAQPKMLALALARLATLHVPPPGL
jgi:transcriptional regulator with XRE-family HTH domain